MQTQSLIPAEKGGRALSKGGEAKREFNFVKALHTSIEYIRAMNSTLARTRRFKFETAAGAALWRNPLIYS